MEWTIQISAGVCHHFDLTDLKFGSWRIAIARLLARKVVGNNGSRQTLVGDHAIFNRMANVDQIECGVHRFGTLQITPSASFLGQELESSRPFHLAGSF